MTNEFPTLADLDKIQLPEVKTICQTARTVNSGMHIQLQAALALIRAKSPDDAIAFIERAVAIGQRWAGGGATCPLPE